MHNTEVLSKAREILVYNKRIAFIISAQSFKPYGGIGQFALGFVREMAKANVKVDIIMDHINQSNKTVDNIITPNDPLSYKKHNNIFMYKDTYNLERMINFREAIMIALETNLYDTIICNHPESYRVISEMGLEDIIQIINYTHYETQIFPNVTTDPFLSTTRQSMLLANQTNIQGTQSLFNANNLPNGIELPIFISEPLLLHKQMKERNGILFIGTNEDRKGAKTFIDIVKQTKLPAKILTNEPGAKKFKASLKEINATYEIKTNTIGKEKVDFIASARVGVNLAIGESFGIAMQEQIIQLPTVGISNTRWLNNHPSKHFFQSNKQDLPIMITQLYNEFPTAESYYKLGAIDYYNERESKITDKWLKTINSFNCKQSNTDKANILKHNTISHKEYIKSLNRKKVCIDDIISVYTNKHKYKVIYTDTDTWLTTDKEFVVPKTESLFIFNTI